MLSHFFLDNVYIGDKMVLVRYAPRSSAKAVRFHRLHRHHFVPNGSVKGEAKHDENPFNKRKICISG